MAVCKRVAFSKSAVGELWAAARASTATTIFLAVHNSPIDDVSHVTVHSHICLCRCCAAI